MRNAHSRKVAQFRFDINVLVDLITPLHPLEKGNALASYTLHLYSHIHSHSTQLQIQAITLDLKRHLINTIIRTFELETRFFPALTVVLYSWNGFSFQFFVLCVCLRIYIYIDVCVCVNERERVCKCVCVYATNFCLQSISQSEFKIIEAHLRCSSTVSTSRHFRVDK